MANIANSRKKGQFLFFIFLKNKDFCSDIHYETHLEFKCLKPKSDLGVLWLKDAIIVLLETIPCLPASEDWRGMVTLA